jgi:NADH-quinone oxidoreductase subunit N
MYFSAPADDATAVAIPSALTTVAIGIGALMTVLLGIVPGPLLDLASRSSQFIP